MKIFRPRNRDIAARSQTWWRAVAPAALLLITGSLAAEYPSSDLLIKNWRTTDGVPHNTVRTVITSREGYMWLGTANGLAQFDGVRFVTFNRVNTPEMVDDDIYCLHQDRAGDLWYRTRRGIGRRHEGRFQFFETTGEERLALFGVFSEDRDGQLWLHGRDGLTKLFTDRRERVPWAGPEPAAIKHACAARDGGLWLATEDGVWRYRNGKAEPVKRVAGVTRLADGRDGSVWALVDGRKIYQLKGEDWTLAADLGDVECYQIFALSNGDVWAVVEKTLQIFRLRGETLTAMDEGDGLQGNRVLALLEDPEGNVWLGSNAGGLYQLRERRVTVYDRRDGLLGVNTASLTQRPDGAIMLNVMGSTLYRFGDDRFHPIPVESDTEIYEDPTAVVPALSGGVWAGTFWGTLPRVERGKVVERIGSRGGTRSLFTDRSNRLWRGTRTDGIEVFSGTNVVRYSTENGLSFNNVYCFAQDLTGAVWAGTENGLNRILDGEITRFGLGDGLVYHFVSALFVDSRGTLWVGTLGGGLSAWDGDRFVTITSKEGLANDSVEQILEDDQENLWLGTRVGLMRIAVAHLHEYIEGSRTLVAGTLLGTEQGLPGANFWTEYQPASLRDVDGNLWFCTGGGVVTINPKEFTSPTSSPIVQLEEIVIDGVGGTSGIVVGDEIRMEPASERIEIRYTGISYHSPAQTRFRYRLKGYDRDWIDAGHSRVVSYSHLPPRQYQFEVAAMNSDGIWSPANGFSFVVLPSVWQSWWFRSVVALTLLSGLGVSYAMRIRGLEKRRVAQERFSHRLIDSQEKERKRIAAELHDSLGQNLLVVRQLAHLGANAEGRGKDAAQQFEEISMTTKLALDEVRAISHALRPIELDRLGLTKSITECVRRMSEASAVRFDTHIENIDHGLRVDGEINLYRIVQECLSNIVKHSQAGTASVEIRTEKGKILLDVTDDGCGFDIEESSRAMTVEGGIGFSSIIERARALGGLAFFHSRPGGGTRIEVTIPLAASHMEKS